MKYRSLSALGFLLSSFFSCSVLQKDQKAIAVTASVVKSDTSRKNITDSTRPPVLKPYKEVITAKAKTDSGLIIVHKINERYFFEIPNSILEKDILLVSRIEQGAARVKKMLGYAGDQVGESEIRFSKGPSNKLFIRLMSYFERSNDSSANGMYRAVTASNLQPIQAAFDIKALSSDSSSVVIDITDFLNSDNPLLYFDGDIKKNLDLGGYQKDRSYISGIKTFPQNVELQSVLTYLTINNLPATYELNVSFVLLPDQPMQSRYFDKRVGYFTQSYLDYDSPGELEPKNMITRWRLEPKEADKDRYLRGELVEPKKPIVYYIDPATPKKWVPYLIQGVNDWQKAFEKAGFKNAIYALTAPTDDSSFSLLDARHNAIIYKPSFMRNASGPQVHDPRTGEILETHINWYHNIQGLLHNWYMIQAGPNDPGARKMVFDDSLMGQLIRFVCTHEVGHTLGLRHNMGASSTVPTDSLRSKTYLDKNGFCPSIMDYARFNYVAQPEDRLSRRELLPHIGVYDEWAIEWGYRWLPQLDTKENEITYMDQWIASELLKDKRLWWGEFEPGILTIVTDPRRQSEDLGDDAMKASYYGVQNLKRVMSHLREWSGEAGKDYEGLKEMYNEVVNQYVRYVMHVANNIGNKYWTEKTAIQPGPVVQFIPKTIQKKALKFLCQELFDTPQWLYDKDIFALVGGMGDYQYLWIQKSVIDWLITFDSYLTMSWATMQQPQAAYSSDEFLTDTEEEIWKELKTQKPITFSRRNLQKAYTERLIQYSLPIAIEESARIKEKNLMDFYPLCRKHLTSIVKEINKQLSYYKDEESREHLIEVKARMLQALNFTRFPQQMMLPAATVNTKNFFDKGGVEKASCLTPEYKNMYGAGSYGQANSLLSLPCFYGYNHSPNQK